MTPPPRYAAACVLICVAVSAQAQDKPADYPKRPIRIVVGIAPGGGLDLMSRVGAQKLVERWKQPVIVDNRPGGGTLVGMDIVAQAVPDGYTLLGASETLMLNGVFQRAKYDVRSAFVPIVQLTSQPYALIAHPAVPVTSVKELIAYAKARPRVLNYGSSGQGTVNHIGMERLKLLTGIDLTHVPYKGAAQSLIDVLSGQIQLSFSSTVSSGPHMKSGKVRGLAYTGLRRTPLFPDLPTVSEAGVAGFELHNTYGYLAPAGTPRAILQAIAVVVSQGMNTQETAKALAADGNEVVPPTTLEALKAKFDKEYAELETVIRTLKITIN